MRACATRAATSGGADTVDIGTTAAPSSDAPSQPATKSREFGAISATRSPAPMPRARSPAAARRARSAVAAKLHARPPSSTTKTRSPHCPAACRQQLGDGHGLRRLTSSSASATSPSPERSMAIKQIVRHAGLEAATDIGLHPAQGLHRLGKRHACGVRQPLGQRLQVIERLGLFAHRMGCIAKVAPTQ